MKEDTNKTKWLHLRLSEDERKQLLLQFSKTTCRKLSDYARKILLGKPVVGIHRNQSLDDFMTEMIQLRKELNAVGNNFNQAVKKLHTLDHAGQAEHWVIAYELSKRSVQKSVEHIENVISKIADQWLQ
jgi:predicted transglutaminase-like cysteine proteinase